MRKLLYLLLPLTLTVAPMAMDKPDAQPDGNDAKPTVANVPVVNDKEPAIDNESKDDVLKKQYDADVKKTSKMLLKISKAGSAGLKASAVVVKGEKGSFVISGDALNDTGNMFKAAEKLKNLKPDQLKTVLDNARSKVTEEKQKSWLNSIKTRVIKGGNAYTIEQWAEFDAVVTLDIVAKGMDDYIAVVTGDMKTDEDTPVLDKLAIHVGHEMVCNALVVFAKDIEITDDMKLVDPGKIAPKIEPAEKVGADA